MLNIRDENVLRELNLYPLWVRKEMPATLLVEEVSVQQSLAVVPDLAPVVETVAVSEVKNDWPTLKQRVAACVACNLRAGCTQTVFGVGDERAEWLFVGEAPGEEEDISGEPFVGQAGRLLDNMLAAIKLKRGKNVYIANVVKCRPQDDRAPEASEIAQCLPYLQQQIALIQPKVIVALGKTAATSLLGIDATVGSLRNKLHDYQGIPVIITYHPAYLLRKPTEKAHAWDDLCMAVKTMQQLQGTK